MPVYSWDVNQEEIISRLKSKATLKLCVKLLDEPFLIENWIQHHAKIVGFENLILADNGSTDKTTLDVYDRYNELVTIFRFDGPHNEIHWHPRFTNLFRAIKDTSKYFSFVDVDERLILIDGANWIADGSIVSAIGTGSGNDVIPTTWLINVLNSFDTFSLLDTEALPDLKNNLRWGKPVLPVELVGREDGIHNVQFDHYAFSTQFGVSLFLLHYTQFPEQRIAANRNKLVSRGIIDKATSIQDIARMNFKDYEDNSFMRFVDEIKRMLSVISKTGSDCHTSDYLRLEPDGSIFFSSDHAREVFSRFLTDGPSLVRLTFHNEPEGMLVDAGSLLSFALELRRQGEGARAERLLRRGMVLYPDFLDQYQMPAFRKELMRTYLARQDWAKATALCPRDRDSDGDHWHFVLFARAFSQIGENETAASWWRSVLFHEPNNKEARSFLTMAGTQIPI